MECTFQGPMISMFSSVLQCFSKMSTDFTIQCSSEKIEFQVVGLSFQSFFSLSFHKQCFSSFQCLETVHYGISSKAVMPIFKDCKHIESVVIKIEQSDSDYSIVFELLCNHHVRKVYRARLFDSNLSKVNFNENQSTNSITIRPDLFHKAIQYLKTGSEIVMKVMQSSISMENIPTEGEVRTVSNLSTSDVDDISIISPTSLRFLTAGLLVVLQFMHSADIKLIQIQFGEGGSVLRLGSKPGCEKEGIEVEYILVTAPEEEYISNDRILDTTEIENRPEEFQSKRVELSDYALHQVENNTQGMNESEKEKEDLDSENENDDEFWKRRQDDEEEWY